MIAKKIALGFGIAVILPMMIHYGVGSFIENPNWNDSQIDNYYEKHKRADEAAQKDLEAKKLNNRERFESAKRHYQKSLFFVAVPVGLFALLIGSFIQQKGLGTGLMFGGIFSICNGYANNWDYLDDRLKFISLLAAFFLFVWISYKKLEPRITC